MSIINFLYQGEANVSQDDLDSFLTVAEELKLRGVAGDSQSKEEQQKETHPKSKRNLSKREYGQQPVPQHEQPNYEIHHYYDLKDDKAVALANTKTSVELQYLDGQIKSMITKSDISAGPGKGLLATCNVCGKE